MERKRDWHGSVNRANRSSPPSSVRLSRGIHISSISPRDERQRGRKALTNVIRASYFKHCHLYVLDRGNEVTMTSTIPSFSLPRARLSLLWYRTGPLRANCPPQSSSHLSNALVHSQNYSRMWTIKFVAATHLTIRLFRLFSFMYWIIFVFFKLMILRTIE